MDLCSNQHGEVCFDSRNCPACEYGEGIAKEKDDELREANRQIDDLESQVNDLHNELSARNNA